MLISTLQRALSVKRKHGAKATANFTKWLETNLPMPSRHWYDGAGNLHVDMRRDITVNKTMFTAHVDTVHRDAGANKISKVGGFWYANGAPLGADDGAGCAMLMHLMASGVPAYYLFTQGEECGGIGATYVAEHHKDLLAQFDRAIAFDRRGLDSVITHQGWGRCCSDTFGQALADALNADETLMYLPDDSGVYTDTAEFVGIIPECTNLSIGYYNEHSDKEKLDMTHLVTLAQRVARLDWDSLPTERDPAVKESKYDSFDYGASPYNSAFASYMGDGLMDMTIEDFETLDLQDAIMDAQIGMPEWLMEMMAQSVYPEDERLAMRFIDKKLLTDEVLEHAFDMSRVASVGEVLATLFDHAHTGV